MRTETPGQKLKSRDAAEIIIGSLVLAFPVAMTEEVWNLSMELSIARTIVISLSSLVFISVFVQTTYSHDFSFPSQKQLLARVLSVYGLEFWFLAGQARGGLPQDVGVREDRKTVEDFIYNYSRRTNKASDAFISKSLSPTSKGGIDISLM